VADRPRIRFLLDSNVSNSISGCLHSHGHEVHRIDDYLLPGAEDRLVVSLANELDSVVVTFNRKHFRALVHRDDPQNLREFLNAGLLVMQTKLIHGITLLDKWMPLIELAFGMQQQNSEDRRFIAELSMTGLLLR
jgi:hypothetical protein